MRRARRGFLVAALALVAAPAAADDEARVWAALRAGGHVVLVRHASTEPGLGDPPGYRLDDCATQRNLSARGREESRRIGERFRQEGVVVERVFTSPWCRCRDTAMERSARPRTGRPVELFDDAAPRARAHRAREEPHRHYSTEPKGTVVMGRTSEHRASRSKPSAGRDRRVLRWCCGLRMVGRIGSRHEPSAAPPPRPRRGRDAAFLTRYSVRARHCASPSPDERLGHGMAALERRTTRTQPVHFRGGARRGVGGGYLLSLRRRHGKWEPIRGRAREGDAGAVVVAVIARIAPQRIVPCTSSGPRWEAHREARHRAPLHGYGRRWSLGPARGSAMSRPTAPGETLVG